MATFVPVQSSVQGFLLTYNRQLADLYFGRKLNRMYASMLQSFLAYEPWKANPPFEWCHAKIHGATGAGAQGGGDLGWLPMNMRLPADVVEKIKQVVDYQNVYAPEGQKPLSVRTFLYTAVVWWCTQVYPYKGPFLLDGLPSRSPVERGAGRVVNPGD